jgi:hypothetical protein
VGEIWDLLLTIDGVCICILRMRYKGRSLWCYSQLIPAAAEPLATVQDGTEVPRRAFFDEKRAKKLLRKQGTELAVYNRLIPAASEPLASVQDGPEVPQLAEWKELLREDKDLFRVAS